jgi:spermidine/putrescine transport system permease protein
MRVTRSLGGLLVAPLSLFLIATVIVPAGILFVYSFYDFSLYQVHRAFELRWYRDSLSDPLYRAVIRNTLAIAVPTTMLSVAGGFCIAYFIVFRARRARTLVFALVIVSMLASYLARVYAWRILMGEHGVINSALESLGLIDHPLGWLLFSRAAVITAEVNLYMPITTLIVFASLSSVPDRVRDASRDLGAGPFQTFRRVTLPLTGRGVLGAATLAFFLSCGDYITPAFLGGPSTSQTFGTTIASAISTDGNYPLGAALSFVMIALFLLYTGILVLVMRRAKLLPRLR